MPDGMVSILIFIVWLFIMNRVNAFFKKAKENARKAQQPVPQTQQTQQKQPEKFKSLQEILKDLQKQAEAQSGQKKQEIPPVVQKQVPPVAKKVQRPTVYKHKHTVSSFEEKVSQEFAQKVALERETEHDAEPNIMTDDAYAKKEDDGKTGMDFDLRSAIIASIILERPYS
ncbi:MAG: hypothetical protein R2794_12395 [Chitinophagales bacterium]